MIVGLTGGIGSGKTTVLKQFKKFKNISIYIADIEAKKLMNTSQEIRCRIIDNFGKCAYKNKEINSLYLSDIVFKNKKKLTILNSIVHPFVYQNFQKFIYKNQKKDYILYENAILFENGSNQFCTKIITVTTSKSIRIQRVIKRDKITRKEVLNRMENQWDDEKKILQSHYIIQNILIKNTLVEVLKIHNKLIKN